MLFVHGITFITLGLFTLTNAGNQSYFPRNEEQRAKVLKELGKDPYGMDPNGEHWLFHRIFRPLGFDSVRILRKWLLHELTVRNFQKLPGVFEEYGIMDQCLHLFFKHAETGWREISDIIRHFTTIVLKPENKKLRRRIVFDYVRRKKDWNPKWSKRIVKGVQKVGILDKKCQTVIENYLADFDNFTKRFSNLHRQSRKMAKPYYQKWGFPSGPWVEAPVKKRTVQIPIQQSAANNIPDPVPVTVDDQTVPSADDQSEMLPYQIGIAILSLMLAVSLFLNCYLCSRASENSTTVNRLRRKLAQSKSVDRDSTSSNRSRTRRNRANALSRVEIPVHYSDDSDRSAELIH